MKNSFYTESELKEIGLKSFGKNVLISRKTSIYGASNISIGDNVRIDDFCILSGNIQLGNYIHIGAASLLFGGGEKGGIIFEDYTAISSRGGIYAVTDDYSGVAFTNPTLPDEFRNVIEGKIIVKKYAVFGTGVTILPNVTIGEGVAVGAMSMVAKSLDDWIIYSGVPCRAVKERSRKILDLAKEFEQKKKID